MPKVSVLMPVYNAERFLKEAIDSIVHQSFSDWELVLINDGSTDGSEEIILSYSDSRIKYVKNDSNLKLIQTLNKGIKFCEGEYIARMDADDVAHPQRLARQVEFLDKHPQHVLCGTNAVVIDEDGKKVGKIYNFTSDEYLKIHLLFSNPFIHPATMMRKDALGMNGYDQDYKHVEDYELWCRISQTGMLANLDEELLSYRWHSTNVSVLHSDEQAGLKDKVIKEQLQKLGIEASEDDLYCHNVTFQLYALGQKRDLNVDEVNKIEAWFTKLIECNEAKRIYDINNFRAFLLSRWMVLCNYQKTYKNIFSTRLASYNPVVLTKLCYLILHLKNK